MNRAVPLACLVIGAGLLLGACGEGDTTTVIQNTTVTETTGETSTTATTTSTTDETTTPEDAAGDLTQSQIPTGGSFVFFRTPSKNIGCVAAAGELRCDILKRDWEPPPSPSPCELDYGHGLELGDSGPARFVCAGDTVVDPSSPVLGYGEYIEAKGFRCESAESGLSCVSQASGHGFTLSRERFTTF